LFCSSPPAYFLFLSAARSMHGPLLSLRSTCSAHPANPVISNASPSKTTRTGSFIRLLQETDKGFVAAAVSCRRRGNVVAPPFSFRSRGGNNSRERTTRGPHKRSFCVAPAAGRGRKEGEMWPPPELAAAARSPGPPSSWSLSSPPG
jgi:hypothetical protein